MNVPMHRKVQIISTVRIRSFENPHQRRGPLGSQTPKRAERLDFLTVAQSRSLLAPLLQDTGSGSNLRVSIVLNVCILGTNASENYMLLEIQLTNHHEPIGNMQSSGVI